MVINVEVIHDEAINLLTNMEHLNLIRLNIPKNNTFEPKEKLSEQFAGSLQLSDSVYKAFQNTLREGRNEWNRDIY